MRSIRVDSSGQLVLNGTAIYFTLQEFRVQPAWDGGEPLPDPPVHQKGLISFTGFKQPAYYVVREIFHATAQHDARDGG